MLPKVRKHGLRYLLDKKYRKKCKYKDLRLKQRLRYGTYRKRAKSLKNALFHRDGRICFWCNEPMQFNDATIDHVIPASVHKNNKLSNLRLLHNSCRVERDRLINKGILKVPYEENNTRDESHTRDHC